MTAGAPSKTGRVPMRNGATACLSRQPHGHQRLFPQPALMFAVKSLGRTMHLQYAPKSIEIAKRLADGGAVETTVEHALMRGLVTA